MSLWAMLRCEKCRLDRPMECTVWLPGETKARFICGQCGTPVVVPDTSSLKTWHGRPVGAQSRLAALLGIDTTRE